MRLRLAGSPGELVPGLKRAGSQQKQQPKMEAESQINGLLGREGHKHTNIWLAFMESWKEREGRGEGKVKNRRRRGAARG